MKFSTTLATAFLAAGLTTPALAQDSMDGNFYLGLCQDMGEQHCTVFTYGMLASLLFWNDTAPDSGGPSFKFCIPGGVSREQGAAIVRDYIEANAATRHYPAGMLAFMAIETAFPCR